jgi:hypothetical protein
MAGCKAAGCDGNDGKDGLPKMCHAGKSGLVKADCPSGTVCNAIGALSDACSKSCSALDSKYGIGSICISYRGGCYAGVDNVLSGAGARWVMDNRPDLVSGSSYFALYANAISGCREKYTWDAVNNMQRVCGSIKLDTSKLLSGKVPSGPGPKPAPAPAPKIARYLQCGGKGGGCAPGSRPCADAAWTSTKCVAGTSCRRTNEWHWQCE